MYTKYPDGSISCSACVRAIDFIRIADQIMKDNMKYVQINVIHNDYGEEFDGLIKLSAIPDASSKDATIYPPLKGMLTIEIDDDDD